MRKQIKRLALAATFEKLPRCIVGMEACLSAHFVSRNLREMGFEPRIIPAIYVKPFNKGQKNDYNDAEAIAEAALRPNLQTVSEKSQDQLDLQALHRVRSRLVSRRTATINQIRAFLIEQGITVRKGLRALKNSFETILEERKDEISPRMRSNRVGAHLQAGKQVSEDAVRSGGKDYHDATAPLVGLQLRQLAVTSLRTHAPQQGCRRPCEQARTHGVEYTTTQNGV